MANNTKSSPKLLRRCQLVHGKTYEVVGPKGEIIKGTFDLIPCTALADSVKVNAQRKIEPEYQDQSDVNWDGQKNKLFHGQRLWVSQNGTLILESRLRFRETAA